tara:strand:- start:35 stop:313 length:279 start_codon:yes stop_codon:yes gene_type:complete
MPIIIIALAIAALLGCLKQVALVAAFVVTAGLFLEAAKREPKKLAIDIAVRAVLLGKILRRASTVINFAIANVIRTLLFLPMVDYTTEEWQQ